MQTDRRRCRSAGAGRLCCCGAQTKERTLAKDRRSIRYAVVGLGHIAQVAVLPAFAHAKRNSQLAAVVSDDNTKRPYRAGAVQVGEVREASRDSAVLEAESADSAAAHYSSRREGASLDQGAERESGLNQSAPVTDVEFGSTSAAARELMLFTTRPSRRTMADPDRRERGRSHRCRIPSCNHSSLRPVRSIGDE